MDVGTTLRTARERRGLTVNDVSVRTRITVPLIMAIEQNAFEKVPGGIFVRGFLRSYAREVGLDPEDTVSQFLEETGDSLQGAGPLPEALDDELRVQPIEPEPSAGRATWGYALIVAALAVAFVSSTRDGRTTDAVVPVQAAQEDPVPAVASDAAEPEAVATTGNGLLRFDIVPSGPCWVEAIVDGRRVVYRMMQPGDRETLSAREIDLRVGDPAAFTYTINGRPGRSLGPAGTPVSVRLTSESYQEFVAS
jgi:cytoskeletal protein RodZ